MHSVEVGGGSVLEDSVVRWVVEQPAVLIQPPQQLEPISRQEVALDGLEALRQAVRQAEQQGARLGSIRRETTSHYLNGLEALGNHAAPLAPLRDRDLIVLEDWFYNPAMQQIEADYQTMLQRLLPEPCWEDDWLELLREFD